MARRIDRGSALLDRWFDSLTSTESDPELEELAETAMNEAAAWADGQGEY